jgi:hypothetical protein
MIKADIFRFPLQIKSVRFSLSVVVLSALRYWGGVACVQVSL